MHSWSTTIASKCVGSNEHWREGYSPRGKVLLQLFEPSLSYSLVPWQNRSEILFILRCTVFVVASAVASFVRVLLGTAARAKFVTTKYKSDRLKR